MLTAIIYYESFDMNHKIGNIVSTERYTRYAGAAGILLHRPRKLTLGNETISFVNC